MTRSRIKRRLRAVRRRLLEEYGEPPRKRRDPVDVLIGTILSQNTTDKNAHEAFRRLKERFRAWEEAADAPVEEIVEAIKVAGLSNIRGPRIKRILQQIREREGRVSLARLGKLSPKDALRELLSFDGVGPKTARCVLLFAFDMDVFPVDTHILRISKRLGLVPPNCTQERAHEILEPAVPKGAALDLHLNMIAHGRLVCRPRDPDCEECVLLDLCPHGRELLGLKPRRRRSTHS